MAPYHAVLRAERTVAQPAGVTWSPPRRHRRKRAKRPITRHGNTRPRRYRPVAPDGRCCSARARAGCLQSDAAPRRGRHVFQGGTILSADGLRPLSTLQQAGPNTARVPSAPPPRRAARQARHLSIAIGRPLCGLPAPRPPLLNSVLVATPRARYCMHGAGPDGLMPSFSSVNSPSSVLTLSPGLSLLISVAISQQPAMQRPND